MKIKRNIFCARASGFTLIELLVVIAIIGVLSSVILAAIGGTKGKSRIANAQKIMSSLKAVVNTCMADSSNILDATTPGTSIVCTGSSVWPILPSNTWLYASTTGTTAANCHNDLPTNVDEVDEVTGDGNFQFCAYSSVDGKTIICTQDKCTLSNYQ